MTRRTSIKIYRVQKQVVLLLSGAVAAVVVMAAIIFSRMA